MLTQPFSTEPEGPRDHAGRYTWAQERAFSSSVASDATIGGSGSDGSASAARHSRTCARATAPSGRSAGRLRQQPPYVGLCRGTHLSTSSATTTQRDGNCSAGVQVCSLKPAHLTADTASTDLLRRLGPGPCGHRCMIAAPCFKLMAGMSCYAHAAACFGRRGSATLAARRAPRPCAARRTAWRWGSACRHRCRTRR
jgi:hypothetical protein